MSTHTKMIFLPPTRGSLSSLASFQEHLHPNRSTVNDSTCCSSYSRPIGSAWNSPKTEKKRRHMHIKLAHCKQTVNRETKHNKKKMKMASTRKPEAFVWTDNEAELLLRLMLDYKASKLQEAWTQAVVGHCCCCCCYEMSQGSEVRSERSRGGAMASSIRKVCRFAIHTRTQGKHFWIFPPWDPVSK